MHTKAKGRELAGPAMCCVTECLVKQGQQPKEHVATGGLASPVALSCADLISLARQGSLVSNSLESNQIPASRRGGVNSVRR